MTLADMEGMSWRGLRIWSKLAVSNRQMPINLDVADSTQLFSTTVPSKMPLSPGLTHLFSTNTAPISAEAQHIQNEISILTEMIDKLQAQLQS
jgi:hypothetical protein